MRVLMFNYEYPPIGGGAANATQRLLQALAERGRPTVDLVTSSVGATVIEHPWPTVTVHRLNIGKKGSWHYQNSRDLLTYSLRAGRYATRLRRHYAYDLAHAFFGIPGGWLARRTRLPYIVSLRGSDVPGYNPRFHWLDQLLFRRLSRSIWHESRAVIANSQGLRQLAWQTAPTQPIDIIPNGVDTNDFSPAPQPTDRPLTILSTSRLTARKGLGDLLDGFARFHPTTPTAILRLVGDGDIAPVLKARADALGLTANVQFVGRLDHHAIADEYRRADIFVLPSRNEGMSNSLLEAMASGLAIVTTETGGTRELVNDENGIVIRSPLAPAIAEALRTLAADPERRRRMMRASRLAAETMSWSAMADAYQHLYERITA